MNTETTAIDFVKGMKIGWNLGNSLDATGNGVNSETSWGNPKVTEDMIKDVKAMGFDTIRIPTSWAKHCDKDGSVDPAWMDRVREVVDYAYNNGMYVILNTHHDNPYYDIGGCAADEAVLDETIKKMTKLWTEISETFKGYSERLIFETLNEPRTEGSAAEWSGGTKAERQVVYRLNREIVKAIRATGGNNTYRFIMVPNYAATPNIKVLMETELPEDERIIMSVHAYSPYNFAMNPDAPGNFTDSDAHEIKSMFEDLNSIFVKKGIPVIMGEFGATNKDNLEDRCKWAETYVRTAKQYGIACVVWDNNDASGAGAEYFGLYDRKNRSWYYEDLAKAYVKAAETE